MKELWSYMAPALPIMPDIWKRSKIPAFGDYEAAVMSLFGEQEILKV